MDRRTDDVEGRTDIFSCFDTRRQILLGVGGTEIGSQKMNIYLRETSHVLHLKKQTRFKMGVVTVDFGSV